MPVQYTQKRFIVLGENSKTAKQNYDAGYDRIDWPNRPKATSSSTASTRTPTPRA